MKNASIQAKKRTGLKLVSALMASLMLIGLLASCSAKSDDYERDDVYAQIAPGAPSIGTDNGYSEPPKDSGSQDIISDTRYIIKTVNTTVRTEDYDGYITALKSVTDTLGGYYSSASFRDNSYSSYKSRIATIVIRVPADKLDSFISSLSEGGSVISYYENVDDVTAQYIDIDSRIRVLEAEEVSLLAILEKTETVEQMLAVRSVLTSVQSDLASLKAQKNALASKIAYSTVNLTVEEVAKLAPAEDASFWEELSDRFASTATSIAQGLRAFVLWLLGDSLYILIVLACLSGAFFLVRYIFKKKKSQ